MYLDILLLLLLLLLNIFVGHRATRDAISEEGHPAGQGGGGVVKGCVITWGVVCVDVLLFFTRPLLPLPLGFVLFLGVSPLKSCCSCPSPG